ncbi:MAG: hypothetical protein AAGA10_25495 [Bacteroidota bacterium]
MKALPPQNNQVILSRKNYGFFPLWGKHKGGLTIDHQTIQPLSPRFRILYQYKNLAMDLLEHITFDPRVMKKQGILADYSYIERKDIQACLLYAKN